MSQDESTNKFEDFLKIVKNDSSVPDNNEIYLLQRFFKVCDNDSVKALELYKSNLTLRLKGPQLFKDRDVLSDQIQNISKIVQFCPLPKLTDDNRRILLIRYKNSNLPCCVDTLKMLLMMLDARYSLQDENGKLADDDVLIIDLKGYTFRHFLNAARNSKTIFLYFKFAQECSPIPTRSCHILNSSGIVNSFMSLIRPMLRKEVADSFQFHSDGFENLHKAVPKEVLPEEYGGEIPMDDIHEEWMEIFKSKRDYLLNENNWRISE